jgi:carbonic anhydrase/acetyltransferase-like protein (isoleucine patch superfamily)
MKRTHIKNGCDVAFGATVMGGAVIEREHNALAAVHSPQRDELGHSG